MQRLLALLAVALAAGRPARAEDPDLTAANYAATRDAVLPTESESGWLKIPWRTSFWSGMREAARAGKPLLLWAMNGHPLACT